MGFNILANFLNGRPAGVDVHGREQRKPLIEGIPEFITATIFCHYAHDETRLAFVSLERIARETGLAYRTVKAAKKRLVDCGLLIETGEAVGMTRRVEKYEVVDFAKWLQQPISNKALRAPLNGASNAPYGNRKNQMGHLTAGNGASHSKEWGISQQAMGHDVPTENRSGNQQREKKFCDNISTPPVAKKTEKPRKRKHDPNAPWRPSHEVWQTLEQTHGVDRGTIAARIKPFREWAKKVDMPPESYDSQFIDYTVKAFTDKQFNRVTEKIVWEKRWKPPQEAYDKLMSVHSVTKSAASRRVATFRRFAAKTRLPDCDYDESFIAFVVSKEVATDASIH